MSFQGRQRLPRDGNQDRLLCVVSFTLILNRENLLPLATQGHLRACWGHPDLTTGRGRFLPDTRIQEIPKADHQVFHDWRDPGNDTIPCLRALWSTRCCNLSAATPRGPPKQASAKLSVRHSPILGFKCCACRRLEPTLGPFNVHLSQQAQPCVLSTQTRTPRRSYLQYFVPNQPREQEPAVRILP